MADLRRSPFQETERTHTGKMELADCDVCSIDLVLLVLFITIIA